MSEHGTYGRYQKHRKDGEQPCGPCVIANREYMRGYRRRTVDQPVVDAIRAEALLEAREAVIAAGHKRFGVYDECECPDEVREQDGHVIELEDFYGCEKSLVYYACRSCCSENDYHSEHCASDHDHGPDKPYCTAVAAIDALTDKTPSDGGDK